MTKLYMDDYDLRPVSVTAESGRVIYVIMSSYKCHPGLDGVLNQYSRCFPEYLLIQAPATVP